MALTKKSIGVIIAVATIAALIIVFIVLRSKKKSPQGGVLQVPQVEIQNNPIEKKIPEINPVEKANPFKYKNPLVK